MIAITIAATAFVVTWFGGSVALLQRRAPQITTSTAPDLAALTRGRHRRTAAALPDPHAELVRRARARAATVTAVASIPVPRATPENAPEMPFLPVAPIIPAPRAPRP